MSNMSLKNYRLLGRSGLRVLRRPMTRAFMFGETQVEARA